MAPGAGRKKGKVSKAKRELAEMAKEHAEMPYSRWLKSEGKFRSLGAGSS